MAKPRCGFTSAHIIGYDETPCPGPQGNAKWCGCGAASTTSHPQRKPIWCPNH